MADFVFGKTDCDISAHKKIEMSIDNIINMANEYPEFDLDVALQATESRAKSNITNYIKKEVTNKEYPMWDKGYDILKDDSVFSQMIFANFRQRDRFRAKYFDSLGKMYVAENGKHNVILDIPINVIYNFRVDKENKIAVVQFKYNDCGCWLLEDF